MKTLYIDTSNQALSVAVSNGVLLSEMNINVKKTHSETLMPVIDQVLKTSLMKKKELERIVVANGPGSYTGLRIGVTVAKTLAMALNIPIYTVSSLFVMAASYSGVVAPFFDARRGNCFCAIYKIDNENFEELLSPKLRTSEEWFKEVEKFDAVMIHNQLEKQNFEVNAIHSTPRIASIIGKEDALVETNIHEVVPNYLKISEAEKNWKQNQ